MGVPHHEVNVDDDDDDKERRSGKAADNDDVSSSGDEVKAKDEGGEDKEKKMKEDEKAKRKKAVIADFVLVALLVAAVIVGIGLGVGLQGVWTEENQKEMFYLEFPGQLLLNMLKCLILPLMVSSLITATAALDNKASGRLGAAAMTYYMTTTLAAVITGIILVLSIHPGDPDDRDRIDRSGSSKDITPLDALLDLVRTCFPENLVTMCYKREVTQVNVAKVTKTFYNETSGQNETYVVEVEQRSLGEGSGMNVLGIVVISVSLGCVINHLGERGKPLRYFFEALNDATMVLIRLVIWFSPVGIVFLIAAKFAQTEDLAGVAARLGLYMVTVLCGLAIHSLVTLPVLYLIFTRKNPARFGLNMTKAMAVAWGTASSSATLPVTMDCLVNKNKVNEKIVRFVVPIGATINMDGTALYEAVAAIFIAQVNSIDLSIASVIVVSLTATAAAVGAAGVPQAGLVTMVIVLTSVNLPTEDITLILAIDWFLDRFRTAVNVWGDCIGAGILDHFFSKVIQAQEAGEEERVVNSQDDSETLDTSSASGSSSSLATKEKLEAASREGVKVGFDNPAFNGDVSVTKL